MPVATGNDTRRTDVLRTHWSKIKVGYNPRRKFRKIEELAASIKKHGVRKPFEVWIDPDTGDCNLVAGGRRIKACELLKSQGHDVGEVLCIPVPQKSDKKTRIVYALVENDNAEPLLPTEKADAFKVLRDEGLTLEQIAEEIAGDGKQKSTTYIRNHLLLAEAPACVREAVDDESVKFSLNDGISVIRATKNGTEGDIENAVKALIEYNGKSRGERPAKVRGQVPGSQDDAGDEEDGDDGEGTGSPDADDSSSSSDSSSSTRERAPKEKAPKARLFCAIDRDECVFIQATSEKEARKKSKIKLSKNAGIWEVNFKEEDGCYVVPVHLLDTMEKAREAADTAAEKKAAKKKEAK